MKVVYPVIIAPTGKNEYLVTVPDMDVMTQGNSLETARDDTYNTTEIFIDMLANVL